MTGRSSDRDLARAILGPPYAGYGTDAVQTAFLTVYAGAPTYSNEVTDGATKWTDCPIGCPPGGLVLGRVWIIRTAGKPIIGGNLYVPTA